MYVYPIGCLCVWLSYRLSVCMSSLACSCRQPSGAPEEVQQRMACWRAEAHLQLIASCVSGIPSPSQHSYLSLSSSSPPLLSLSLPNMPAEGLTPLKQHTSELTCTLLYGCGLPENGVCETFREIQWISHTSQNPKQVNFTRTRSLQGLCYCSGHAQFLSHPGFMMVTPHLAVKRPSGRALCCSLSLCRYYFFQHYTHTQKFHPQP
jgi:hypothetical protein